MVGRLLAVGYAEVKREERKKKRAGQRECSEFRVKSRGMVRGLRRD